MIINDTRKDITPDLSLLLLKIQGNFISPTMAMFKSKNAESKFSVVFQNFQFRYSFAGRDSGTSTRIEHPDKLPCQGVG
jgi:hypothetical protein